MATPLDLLRNTRGQMVSIELRDGQTVNGSVMRSDRTMNIILKNAIRTSADGKQFYRSREVFIRGASVRNIRMEDRALNLPKKKAKQKLQPQRTLGNDKSKEKSNSSGYSDLGRSQKMKRS